MPKVSVSQVVPSTIEWSYAALGLPYDRERAFKYNSFPANADYPKGPAYPATWDRHTLAASQTVHADTRMTTFRVYLGQPTAALASTVARYFDGATIVYTVGLWQGETESSAIIDIVAPLVSAGAVYQLAATLAHIGAQSSVLVTYRKRSLVAVLVSADGTVNSL